MQQGGSRGAWPSEDDYTLFSIAIILAGIALGLYFLWGEHHAAISAAVMRLARWQMRLIHLFSDRYDLADAQVQQADPERITAAALRQLCRDVGTFYRVPAALLELALAVLCFAGAAPSRFCRNLDLDGLIREQARNFPVIAAYAGRRLRRDPPRSGDPRPLDPALSPAEWIARYATSPAGKLDEAAAMAELTRQLGPAWRGVGSAAPQIRCLYAAFALHLAQRREEALAYLGDLSTALAEAPEPDLHNSNERSSFPEALFADADAWLRDPELAQPAAVITARHGFTAPALMSLLTEARLRSGVLAPAQFSFLRLVDRRLWYALHSLGFPSDGPGHHRHPNPRIEAAGVRAHWEAERAAGSPFRKPMLAEALAAIRKVADRRRGACDKAG